jgi:hypothetical protein
MRAFILLICLAFSLCEPAFAHTRSQSFSSWEINEQDAYFTFAVDARRITQLGTLYPETTNLGTLLETHIRETVALDQAGKSCGLVELFSISSGQNIYRFNGVFQCPNDLLDQPATASIASFFKVSPTHIHLARFAEEDDQVLREGFNQFTLKQGASPQGIFGFVRVGFTHVLSGLDHLVFLVGLALVARGPRQIILCVTGFTLGHTLALGLSTFGAIAPDEWLIEGLIGFTIAVMALEAGAHSGLNRRAAFIGFAFLTLVISYFGNIGIGFILALAIFASALSQISNDQASKLLPVLTIAFGLIHGAGFAGGLQELSLTGAGIWRGLLGFNIGVELAQLLALLIIFAAVFSLSKQKLAAKLPLELYASLMVFGLGCFWFAERFWS